MRSLRARLMACTALVLGGALAAFGGTLYVSVSRTLAREIDARLAGEARALASLVELSSESRWEMDTPPSDVAAFQIWTDDGHTLARSSALAADLPRRAGRYAQPLFEEASSADGGPARRVQVDLVPRLERPAPPRRVTVVVRRDTREAQAMLRLFRYWGCGLGLAVLALALAATDLAVRQGLRPVSRLAAGIAAIEERRLDVRLPEDGIPLELRPVVEKLNEALDRLADSFARERRFSADVSHELRTPLCALRTILEVAASRERDGRAYRAAVEEALGAVLRLQRLVEDLLMLARLESGPSSAVRERVGLHELAEECLRAYAPLARARRLRCVNHIGAEAAVVSDRQRLRLVVGNLVANAVQYTEEGGLVTLEANLGAGIVVDVVDSGPRLDEADLQRVFERFYRVEAARSGSGNHCGIGLSLVRAVCETLGLAVSAENAPEGVRFRVREGAA